MVRIGADLRHHNLKVLSDRPIISRRYADWSMAYRAPKDFVRDQLDRVLEKTDAIAHALRSP